MAVVIVDSVPLPPNKYINKTRDIFFTKNAKHRPIRYLHKRTSPAQAAQFVVVHNWQYTTP
jgi:hypothetical protein